MNLILIRHAKSSWKTNVDDHNRPLSPRGIEDANKVFKELKNNLVSDSIIWCSTAKRTRQTAQIFAEICGYNFKDFQLKNELYTFNGHDLLQILKSNTHQNLIVFCHNNAITDIVNAYGNFIIENVPTCGVVILTFETENFLKTRGIISKTIFPKDLKL